MLVILDEVDHLLRQEGDGLLYQLLRIDEGRNEQGTLSIIIISQEPVLDMLEGAVISRFGQSNHVRLEAYGAEELTAIARQRAELACQHGSVSSEVLTLIGQAAAASGDARMAIELLEGAAKKSEAAGRNEIAAVHVQQLSVRRTDTVEPHIVNDLAQHVQLTLLALCRRLRRDAEVTSGDAERLYRVVCEEYEVKPRSHTTFWKHLKTLEQMGLIKARVAAKSQGRGRTQHLSMPHSLPRTLEKRLESALKQ